MTTPDTLELRRKAEAATPGPWVWHTSCSWRRLKHETRGLLMNVAEPFVASDGHPDLTISRDDMDFIAAANPAVILALLDRLDALEGREAWKPVSDHDNTADEVLVMADGWTKPIVAWRHHPSSRTDMWLTVPGKYQVKPTMFRALPAVPEAPTTLADEGRDAG